MPVHDGAAGRCSPGAVSAHLTKTLLSRIMQGNTISKREVFVIDTDASSREQLSLALEQKAYEVVCFADGASLLSEAKVRMPACVLLEVQAPDHSGLDVLKQLREEN